MPDPTPPSPAPSDPPGAGPPSDPAALRRFGLVAGGGGIIGAIAIAIMASQGSAPPNANPGVTPPAVTAPGPPETSAPDVEAAEETAEPDAHNATPAPVAGKRPASAGAVASAQATPQTAPAARPPTLCPSGGDRPIILVAFERSHPMHEAQRLFAEGRRNEARDLAARLLAERRDLRGLCLDRFSIGGAEIHLGAPSAASLADWVERLSEMDGVERAEAELIAEPY